MRRLFRHIAFGLASGLLLVLSLPKPDIYPLAWVCLIPLLIAIVRSGSYLQAAATSYAAGLVYYAGTCYWIADTMIIYGGLGRASAAAVALLFILVFGLHFVVFGAALHHLARKSLFTGLLLAPFIWVSLELARTYFPFGGFPWMLSGYALAPFHGVLQLASWTGVYGLSFLAVAVNCILAAAALGPSVRWLAAGVAVIAVAWLAPAPRLPDPTETLHVRVEQTNLTFEQSWEPAVAEPLLDELTRLSAMQTAITDDPKLIVWPETPGPFFLDQDQRFRSRMQRIAVENASHFVFGYIGASGESPTNSAAHLDPAGNVVSRYDKIHLVPFGEYVPWRSALFFAEDLLAAVGDFAAGTQYTISRLDDHQASTIICYESIFPGLVRDFVKNGSELIILITNDGWFGESSAPYQHLRMGAVRAVENRRWLVRSANTGISAIIDPYGRIQSETGMNVRAAIEGIVEFRRDRTFYTDFGDVFAYLNVVVLIAGAVYDFRGR